MMTTPKTILATLLLTWFSLLIVTGQSNPENIYSKTLVGQQIVVDILSDEPVKPCYLNCGVFDDMEFPTNEVITPFEGTSRLKLTFSEEFTGSFVLPVEYYEISGLHRKSYQTKIHITVVNSIIETVHDYVASIDHGTVFLSVTANDLTSHPPLSVVDIPHVDGGQAFLIGGQVRFDPSADASGMAYFNYVVENAIGEQATGTASICLLQDDLVDSDTLRFTTTNKEPLSILLPTADFELSASNQLGQAEVDFIGSDVLEYNAPAGYAGIVSFDLIDAENGLLRTVQVDNIDRENRRAIHDDVFYAYQGERIIFNVYKNDLAIRPISSFSKELTYLGDGIFEYTPSADFSGIKNFEYQTTAFAQEESGQIQLVFSNFYPVALTEYKLTTRQAQPLILNYHTPLDNFSFDTTDELPSHGSLSIQNGQSNFSDECNDISGQNLIIYTPQSDFVGIDEFELLYCPSDGECELVKLSVAVEPFDDDCACVGPDCVWPGDLNNDGEVSVIDILSLGYGIGLSGEPRLDTGDAWRSQYAESWSMSQSSSSTDAKYLDANGDGTANILDTAAVSNFYNLHHNLLAQSVPLERTYPFFLTLSDEEPEIGDYLSIGVHWGDAQNPVTDVHGLAYSLTLNPAVFDSASLSVNHLKNQNWLGYNSPTIDMDFQLRAGRVDVVSSRSSGVQVSGEGIVHEIGSIIIEDMDGFKLDDGYVTVPIKVENIRFVDDEGTLWSLPDYETSIRVKIPQGVNEEPTDIKDEHLFVFPNPTTEDINVYLNRNVITSYQLSTASGRVVKRVENLNTQSIQIGTNDIQNGLYFLTINAEGSSLTKKVQILR